MSIRFGYADTELGQVHYRESGAGPPVVLLHESPLSGRIYEATLPYLGQRVRAIAPDTPGYGASEPPPEGINIEGYAERLLLFLDAMQLDQVALVGNHTGGSIGIELAIRYPRRVSGLVVVGSAVFDEEEGPKLDRQSYRVVPLRPRRIPSGMAVDTLSADLGRRFTDCPVASGDDRVPSNG